MCDYSVFIGQTVIVDTYNSATHGVDSCSCDIKVNTQSDNITIDKYDNLVPGYPNCGSYLDLVMKKTSGVPKATRYSCFISKENYEVIDSNQISIDWFSNYAMSNSQYCLKCKYSFMQL